MSYRSPHDQMDAYRSPGPPPPPGPSAAGGTKRGREGKEKETFKCSFPGCGQAYSRMEYLKRHQRKHMDVRPFACKDCDKSFARSDVLLRHKRRCHPTPPPESRSSRSPPPSLRPYQGVPVSSSRNDSRELSPGRERRNTNDYSARAHEGSHKRTRTRTRTRTGSEEEEEDAFALAQHMQASGSGGGRIGHRQPEHEREVYDMGGEYYNLGESSTYTPHLLPMFQNQNGSVPYPSTNNSRHQDMDDHHPIPNPSSNHNHLEDASVLLSMAYPGGVPGDGNRGGSGSASRSSGWRGQDESGDVELGESVGNFLSNMGWLGESSNSGKDDGGGDASKWVSAAPAMTLNDAIDPQLIGEAPKTLPPPTSISAQPAPESQPFLGSLDMMNPPSPSASLSAMFSPSVFGYPAVPPLVQETSEDSSPDDPLDDFAANSAAVMELLEQLGQYQPPEKRTITTDPERPLITIEHNIWLDKAGKTNVDPSSPFYLDPTRFTNCYEIPHWRMPPMRVLSMMASKTYHTVLNHFSFIHQPTFKLHDTAACLAFAICTVGGIRSSAKVDQGWESFLPAPFQPGAHVNGQGRMDGPVVPEASWESLYAKNYASSGRGSASGWSSGSNDSSPVDAQKEQEEEKRMVEQWDGANLVRNDKTNMLVKSFSQAKGVLMTDYNCALLQALVLYHAPYYLSENEQERSMANMFMGTIVNITRQIGFLTPELEHFSTSITFPREPSTPNDMNTAWRRWIQLETRRRTAYLVYHLDTVSALEANIPCILTACEMGRLPLPAPDTLWKAPTAEAWAEAARSYRSMTLDEAMRRVFFLPSYGAFDTQHAAADTKFYNLLNEQAFGPFARVAMVLTLVRGVMDIGEGKRDRGDWRDLTDLWVSCSWLKPGKRIVDGDGREVGEVTRVGLRERFALGLDRWRQGWDFDPLCSSMTGSPANGVNGNVNAGAKACATLMYCEEALPYYWLAQALLGILNSSPPAEPGYNSFRGLKYSEMLKSARTFTRLGEGACGTASTTTDTVVPPNLAAALGTTGLPSGFDLQNFVMPLSGDGTANGATGGMMDMTGLGGIDLNLLDGMGMSEWV